MTEESLFERARERLAHSRTQDQLRAELIQIAPLFHDALRRSRLDGVRPDLRLHVRSLAGGYSGLAIPGRQRTHVLLNSDESTTRRRYTLAHELGHALMAGLDRRLLSIDRTDEDRLCELFASYSLMPSVQLERYFAANGFPRCPTSLMSFCQYFRVGITAAINRLAGLHRPSWSIGLIAASLQPSLTSSAVNLRIDAASFPTPILAPRGKRLSSIGLSKLLAWIRKLDESGIEACGIELRLTLRSSRSGLSGWVGPGRWIARTVSGPGTRRGNAKAVAVVLTLDTSQLRPLPLKGRRHLTARPQITMNERQARLLF